MTAFWSITRKPKICQVWDWWWNINNNIIFHFRSFQRKTNDKMFQKNPILGPFWTLFAQIWAKMNFPKKGALLCQHLNTPIIYYHAKNLEKLMSYSWEKYRTEGRTDRLTERWTDIQRWFYRTLLRTGLQNMSDFYLNDCTYQTISSQYSLLIPPPPPTKALENLFDVFWCFLGGQKEMLESEY